jgi:Fe2+ or Zn2+ uptake regulation protein
MSQEKVYEILKELGGKARTTEIRDRAKAKFPEATLYKYVGQQLNQLEKYGCVKRAFSNGKLGWEITGRY